ncbi:HpcH/HpaI aldolase/citrate lyase family protein [Nocardia jiangsuensis]|uniref:HpcH/HpaI aldolase/citrate lyase family protein n=1 Tax=Nocardia jiangsuensis TaxID=1691563 RepID=A0ABV8DP89_9NOCA
MTTPPVTRSVPATVARTWLLVSAASPGALDESAHSEADQIVLDIEDAVDPTGKPAARSAVARRLEHHRAWVRINDRTTTFWSDDIDQLRDLPGLAGVILAKTEAPEQITETYDRLGARTPVLALVESALGIEEAPRIARARGAFRLAFGSGDYRRDTGTAATDLALAYPRSRLVTASRIGNLPGPIDGPTVDDDPAVLHEKSRLAVSLGLTGKLCLPHNRLGIVNDAFSPTPDETARAREFLADFDARGRVIRDGSDPPRLGHARRIARLADAFGIET